MSNSSKQQPTVESIMAVLAGVAQNIKEISAEVREIAALQKESEQRQKAADERQKAADERQKAADERLKETDAQIKATDAQLKETGVYLKNIGEELGHVGNQWGKVAEYLIGSDFDNILKQQFGIDVSYWVKLCKGKYQGKQWEIDVAAANGEVAVVGEVKVTMTAEKINEFVNNNLRNFHRYVPDHRHKKIYGLIAFVKIDDGYEDKVLTCAREHGLLVVRAIGDTFKLITPAGTELRDYGAGKTN